MTILRRIILCVFLVRCGKAETGKLGMGKAASYKSMRLRIFHDPNHIENSFWQNINHTKSRGFCLFGREASHG
jgi:hypothetical protein